MKPNSSLPEGEALPEGEPKAGRHDLLNTIAGTRLVGLAGAVAISFSGIFIALADVAPATAAFFRTAYALPFLVGLWLLARHRDARPLKSRFLAFGAGLVLALDLTAWHHAIGLIGAGLSTVIANVQVLFVPLAAWFIHGEHPSRRAVALAPLIFIGVILVSGLGQEGAFGDDPIEGVAFGLLTAIFYSSFILLLRASNRQHLVPAQGPLLDATAGAMVGAFLLGQFDASFGLDPTWPAHGWLLAVAVAAQVVGWLAISFALPRLAAIDTSVLLLIQPAATVFWAWLILSETPSSVQWVGVAVVITGVGLFTASLRPTVVPVTEH